MSISKKFISQCYSLLVSSSSISHSSEPLSRAGGLVGFSVQFFYFSISSHSITSLSGEKNHSQIEAKPIVDKAVEHGNLLNNSTFKLTKKKGTLTTSQNLIFQKK